MTTQSSGEMAPRPSIARSDAPLIAHGGSVRLVGQGVRPMALLVLGMHRSGTSALTRVFSLLGAGLPETLIGANSTNPTGHWESDAVRAFNDAALAAAGTEWFDWLPVNEGWARSLAYHGQVDRARDVLRAEFGDAPLFALKDPRICRLAGFWLDVLDAEGIDPAIVMPLRNPLEVAESLSRRDGVDTQIALLVWLRHVLEAERATRGRARMVVSYEQVLDQWAGVADRAARELGVVWPRSALGISEEVEGFLSHDLRHHRRSDRAVVDNPLMSGWVRRTYALLLGWAEGAEKASDYAELDAIRAALDEAGPSFARPCAGLFSSNNNWPIWPISARPWKAGLRRWRENWRRASSRGRPPPMGWPMWPAPIRRRRRDWMKWPRTPIAGGGTGGAGRRIDPVAGAGAIHGAARAGGTGTPCRR
jgi:hypothetical protein